jgi:uncharacterized delta-60 repeat protein
LSDPVFASKGILNKGQVRSWLVNKASSLEMVRKPAFRLKEGSMKLFKTRQRLKFYRPVRLLQQLEERVVLDASVNPVINENPANTAGSTGDAADHTITSSQAGQAPGADASLAAAPLPDNLNQVFGTDLNVVLISNAVDQVEAISNAVTPNAKIIVYDAEHADLSTINSQLTSLVNSTGQKIDHLALVTHGAPGIVQLSESQGVNPFSVLLDPGSWHELGILLDTGARIDLYGCNVGDGPMGAFLVAAISHETGAVVWASNDTTGNVGGADWNLEIRCGESTRAPLLTESALDGTPISLGSYVQGWANACVWNWHTQFTVDDGHMAGCDFGWIGLEVKGDIDGYESGFFGHYAVQGEYVHFTIGNKDYYLTANSVDQFHVYTELGDNFLNGISSGSLYCRIDVTEFAVETKEAYFWGGYCYDAGRDGNGIIFGMTWNDKPYTHSEVTPNIAVNEDDPAGLVINLGTYFHDVEDGDNLTYSCNYYAGPFVEGTPVLDGGTLTCHLQPDANGWGQITVTATDHGYGTGTVPLSEQLTFWVTINPVNDAPTDISLNPSSVNEAQPAGTLVGNFGVTDQDGGTATTYSLVSGSGGADNGSFTINNGKLYTAAPLDFEAKSSYNIRVQVDDGSGGIFQKSMVVSVLDLPETAPSGITLSNHAIAENEPIGTSIGVFTTTDTDPGDSHTYRLVAGDGSGDNASFTIAGATLKTSEMFNYEAKNSYDIRVRTTDFTGLSYEEVMTIHVTDVNEPTVFALDHGAGALDMTFDGDGKVTTDFGYPYQEAHAVVVQPDGKIIEGGRVSESNSPPYSWALVRYNSDGTLDDAFDTDGKTLTSFGDASEVNDLAIQSDGKIVAVGSAYYFQYQGWNFGIARYNADGSPDTSFGSQGKAIANFGSWAWGQSVAIQSDGKILIAGSYLDAGANTDFALARLESDGRLDTSFGVGGKLATDLGPTGAAEMNVSMALQPDGKIVVVGRSNNDFAVARYNSNGTLDSSFDPVGHDGIVTTDFGSSDSANSVALQPDGKIVVAGGNYGNYLLARYNLDGSLDGTFDGDGKVTIPGPWANSVAIQPDGKIVLAGPDSSTPNILFGVTRLNPDGSLDGTFGTYGRLTAGFGAGPYCPPAQPYAVDVQPDGKIIVAGTASLGAEHYYFATARYDCGHLDYLEGSGPQVIDSGIILTDSDGTVASASIQISGTYYAVEDHLDINIATVPGVTASGQGTGTLTLTGTASVADYQNMLQHVTYENSDNDPHTAPRTVTWTVNDGIFDASQGGTIAVIPINDPPMLSDLTTLAYTENGGPVLIDSDITLIDPDSSDMVSATIRITGNYRSDQDTLRIDDGDRLGGVVSNWNAAMGTLTLTGSTSRANYESMLERVKYVNTSDDPNTIPRVITWAVTDSGLLTSTPQSSTITVIAVNDAPTDTTLGGSTVAENQSSETVVGTLGASDPDDVTFTYSFLSNPDNAFQIVGNELRTAKPLDHETAPTIDITLRVTDTGDPALSFDKVFTITVSDVNEPPTDITLSNATIAENAGANAVVGALGALDSDNLDTHTFALPSGVADNDLFDVLGGNLVAKSSLDYEADSSYTVHITATDSGGLFTEKDFVISMTNVNEAPAGTDHTVSMLEDGTYSITLADFGFTDPLDSSPNGFAAVKITEIPLAGTLNFGGLAVTADQVIDVADIAAGHLTFSPAGDANGTGYSFFKFAVIDDGGTDNGGVNIDPNPRIMSFDVTAINDEPLADPQAVTVNEDEVVQVTLTGSAGPANESGQTLTYFIDSLPVNGALYASLSDAQSGINALSTGVILGDAVFYRSSLNENSDTSFGFHVVDDGGVANGGDDTSLSSAVDITVSAVNDAPTSTVPSATRQTDPSGAVIFSLANGNLISIADVDAGTGHVRVTLSATHGTMTLRGVAGLTFDLGQDGTADATMTFNGSLTDANNALNGMSFNRDAAYIGLADVTVTVNDQGNTGSGGALTASAVANLSVEPYNVWFQGFGTEAGWDVFNDSTNPSSLYTKDHSVYWSYNTNQHSWWFWNGSAWASTTILGEAPYDYGFGPWQQWFQETDAGTAQNWEVYITSGETSYRNPVYTPAVMWKHSGSNWSFNDTSKWVAAPGFDQEPINVWYHGYGTDAGWDRFNDIANGSELYTHNYSIYWSNNTNDHSWWFWDTSKWVAAPGFDQEPVNVWYHGYGADAGWDMLNDTTNSVSLYTHNYSIYWSNNTNDHSWWFWDTSHWVPAPGLNMEPVSVWYHGYGADAGWDRFNDIANGSELYTHNYSVFWSYNTNHNSWWYWDGTAWKQVSGLSLTA